MSIGCCLYRFHQHSVLLDRDYWVAPTISPHFQYHTLNLVVMTYSITVLLHFQCTALLNLSICYTSVCNCRSNTITLMKTWNKVENLVKKTTWVMKQIYRLNICVCACVRVCVCVSVLISIQCVQLWSSNGTQWCSGMQAGLMRQRPGHDTWSWLCSQLACLGWVITWIHTVSSSISLNRMLGGKEWHLPWAALEISFTSIPGRKLLCITHVNLQIYLYLYLIHDVVLDKYY